MLQHSIRYITNFKQSIVNTLPSTLKQCKTTVIPSVILRILSNMYEIPMPIINLTTTSIQFFGLQT